jgi:pantetheine hydrolase
MLRAVLAAAVIGLSTADYIGAVVEHDIYLGVDGDTATELLQKNLAAYEELTHIASLNGANVVVFPEFGITAVKDSERTSLYPFAEAIPESSSSFIPCTDTESNYILKTSSCMAMNNHISVLVNTIDDVACSKETDSKCPDDSRYLYNTDIVFDETGAFVAKYHKSNEWPGLMPPYNQPEAPSMVTYNASFGVNFGVFTCFDIMHENPPVELVNAGLKHFLYPVKQGDAGEKTLISGWSRKHDVTILSANLGAGDERKQGDCSGIIKSGKDLPTKKFFLRDSGEAFKDSPDNVLVAVVPM